MAQEKRVQILELFVVEKEVGRTSCEAVSMSAGHRLFSQGVCILRRCYRRLGLSVVPDPTPPKLLAIGVEKQPVAAGFHVLS